MKDSEKDSEVIEDKTLIRKFEKKKILLDKFINRIGIFFKVCEY